MKNYKELGYSRIVVKDWFIHALTGERMIVLYCYFPHGSMQLLVKTKAEYDDFVNVEGAKCCIKF